MEGQGPAACRPPVALLPQQGPTCCRSAGAEAAPSAPTPAAHQYSWPILYLWRLQSDFLAGASLLAVESSHCLPGLGSGCGPWGGEGGGEWGAFRACPVAEAAKDLLT